MGERLFLCRGKLYPQIKVAMKNEGLTHYGVHRLMDSGECRWVKRVYRVLTKKGTEVLCYQDPSKWWFPLDGSALLKKDAKSFVEVTESYYGGTEFEGKGGL